MAQIEILQTELNYMKSEINNIKQDVKDLKNEIKEGFLMLSNKLEDKYVNKDEFRPFKEKINLIQKALLRVVGFVFTIVLGAVLSTVIMK